MLSEPAFRELLENYINGQATAAEQEIVEQWFELIGEGEPLVQSVSDVEKEQLFLAMQRSQRFQDAAPVAPRRGRLVAIRAALFTPTWKAAAIWGGVILAGWGLLKVAPPSGGGASAETAMLEIKTGQGQIKKIVLPDSSEVWINANTRLQYASDFEADRRIRLDGEALFQVAQDSRHPFTIETHDGLLTRVLGTRFDVESYDQSSATTITVINGKVQVNKQDTVLGVLTREQSIRYEKSQGVALATTVPDAEKRSQWTRGEWEFDNKGIADLKLLLHNQFGVNLVNRQPSLEKIRISINFNAKQKPDEIVSLFCTFLECHYRWKDTATVELY